MDLMSNEGLTIGQLFRKRDLIRELMNLGYDLQKEMDSVCDRISNWREFEGEQ